YQHRRGLPRHPALTVNRRHDFLSPRNPSSARRLANQRRRNLGVQRLPRRDDHIVRQARPSFPHLYAAALGAIVFRDFHHHLIDLLLSLNALPTVIGHPWEHVFPDRFHEDISESRGRQPP